jgi:alkanesulfonate monooxygenase SsuD/methylene tetrahydromethanopterin reductase-like flavin-dependent oxidoreductase (luciferase family)
LHPIATFQYTRDVILPAVARGAEKSGRQLGDIDILGAPFLAIGKDAEGVEKAKDELRQQISFYASTRSYHAVLEYHGWQDVGKALYDLSVKGKWTDMPALITDEMLEQWAVISTYDDFADEMRACSSDVFNTVLLNLPPDARADEDWMRETVTRLHT